MKNNLDYIKELIEKEPKVILLSTNLNTGGEEIGVRIGFGRYIIEIQNNLFYKEVPEKPLHNFEYKIVIINPEIPEKKNEHNFMSKVDDILEYFMMVFEEDAPEIENYFMAKLNGEIEEE